MNGLQIEWYLVNGMETETMNPTDINGHHTVSIVVSFVFQGNKSSEEHLEWLVPIIIM